MLLRRKSTKLAKARGSMESRVASLRHGFAQRLAREVEVRARRALGRVHVRCVAGGPTVSVRVPVKGGGAGDEGVPERYVVGFFFEGSAMAVWKYELKGTMVAC